MPLLVRDSDTGQLRPATKAEADEMYKKLIESATDEATEEQTKHEESIKEREEAKKKMLEQGRVELRFITDAWRERSEFLAQKRDLDKTAKAEHRKSDSEALAKIKLETWVREKIISSQTQDSEIFSQWMNLLIEDNKVVLEDVEAKKIEADARTLLEVKRTFGYCVRLAEHHKVAVRPSQEDEDAIRESFRKYGKPPHGWKVILYYNEVNVPAEPDNPIQKDIFYRLEKLRQQVNAARRILWLQKERLFAPKNNLSEEE